MRAYERMKKSLLIPQLILRWKWDFISILSDDSHLFHLEFQKNSLWFLNLCSDLPRYPEIKGQRFHELELNFSSNDLGYSIQLFYRSILSLHDNHTIFRLLLVIFVNFIRNISELIIKNLIDKQALW